MGRKYTITGHRIRRKSRKGQKHGPSVNKYAHLAETQRTVYDAKDKTFRVLPVQGKPGEVVMSGLRQIFHGRLYELMDDVKIPVISLVPGLPGGNQLE